MHFQTPAFLLLATAFLTGINALSVFVFLPFPAIPPAPPPPTHTHTQMPQTDLSLTPSNKLLGPANYNARVIAGGH